MMSWGNGCHAGDALWTLAYLMRNPGRHSYYVMPEYVEEFRVLCSGSNVTIGSTKDMPDNAQDTWIANGRHEGQGIFYKGQFDIIGFLLAYFNAFGQVWNDRADMLFDFWWLKPEEHRDLVLVLNTEPRSGQCPGYSRDEMNELIQELKLDGQRVATVCTPEGGHKYSLAQIACFSAQAKLIIGGASGPFFVTMNTAARKAHRIVLLDPMKLDYGESVGPIHNVVNVSEARRVLREHHYLNYV